jgi:hypothetical protein
VDSAASGTAITLLWIPPEWLCLSLAAVGEKILAQRKGLNKSSLILNSLKKRNIERE